MWMMSTSRGSWDSSSLWSLVLILACLASTTTSTSVSNAGYVDNGNMKAIRQIPMENSKVLLGTETLLRSFMGAEQRGLLRTKIDKRDSIHSFSRGSTKRK
ncbi:GM15841 [Drosophila sechellia]|uniref:GM15841 n=1 Tax=Drosophila sechellia TaxID=7238 RepID=B4I7R2_DROSE|nr:GM15841 [Drosophila sechellia]